MYCKFNRALTWLPHHLHLLYRIYKKKRKYIYVNIHILIHVQIFFTILLYIFSSYLWNSFYFVVTNKSDYIQVLYIQLRVRLKCNALSNHNYPSEKKKKNKKRKKKKISKNRNGLFIKLKFLFRKNIIDIKMHRGVI